MTPDQDHRDATNELLAMMAYAELAAFWRLAWHAENAPTMQLRLDLSELAGQRYNTHHQLTTELTNRGLTPATAMNQYAPALDAFHARTSPEDWAEALTKLVVSSGLATDVRTTLQNRIDPQTLTVLQADGSGQHLHDRASALLTRHLTECPEDTDRLSLWARQLTGEIIGQAQRVCTDRPQLAAILTGNTTTDTNWADLATATSDLLQSHQTRIKALGLNV